MRHAEVTFRVFVNDSCLLSRGEPNWKEKPMNEGLGSLRLHFVGGGLAHMRLQPWWGPELDFGLVDLQKFGVSRDKPINFRLVWSTPAHQLFANGELIARVAADELARAAELGLPYRLYKSLAPKERYCIRKAPETGDCWELDEWPNYFRTKYNITGGDVGEDFVRSPSNRTQKAREEEATFELGRALQRVIPDDMHIAILTPEVDRGVDCYLRIVDVPTHRVTGIPIQVCEVRLEGEGSSSETAAKVCSAVAAAKQRPLPSHDGLLLCKVIVAKGSALLFDPFVTREHFDRGAWPYEHVVLTVSAGAIVCTAWRRPPGQYFLFREENGVKVTAWLGRTREEIDNWVKGLLKIDFILGPPQFVD